MVSAEAPSSPTGSGGARPPRKLRILVVDDSQDTADALAMLLDLNGHECQTAYDGAQAVEAAARFQPDVVFLDLELPTMSGYESARRIRDQRGTAVILVALTGWRMQDDFHRSKAAGFDHHLTKPVTLDALQKMLDEWGRSSSGGPSATL